MKKFAVNSSRFTCLDDEGNSSIEAAGNVCSTALTRFGAGLRYVLGYILACSSTSCEGRTRHRPGTFVSYGSF